MAHCLQGDTAALAAALPSLAELDLTDNLVADWGFVTGLLTALPSLTALNLSRNRLELPTSLYWGPAVPAAATQLPSLATLVLNSCGTSWVQVGGMTAQYLLGLAPFSLFLSSKGQTELRIWCWQWCLAALELSWSLGVPACRCACAPGGY